MDNSEKQRLLTKFIDEGHGPELAAAMVEPMPKCGGMEYFNGVAHIWYEGTAYPYDDLLRAKEMNGGQFPDEWCKTYRAWKELVEKLCGAQGEAKCGQLTREGLQEGLRLIQGCRLG
jgi:hypothetical protein